MRKEKKPCIFCRGLKLRKIDFLLIIIVALVMYWINSYQINQIPPKDQAPSPTAKQTP